MPWITGGAILGSSLLGSSSSKKAGKAQADAARASAAMLDPWMRSGRTSLYQLRGMMGLPSDDGSVAANPNAPLVKPFGMQDFQESPAYQFNLQQGQKAIDKAAAKRGMFYAPATLQDIGKFSQGLASNEFQNAFNNYNTNNQNIWNRLYALSGTGQNAAAGQGGFNLEAGNAEAAGQVGSANAVSQGVGQGINAYMMNQILQTNQRPTTVPLKGIPGMTGDFGGGGVYA